MPITRASVILGTYGIEINPIVNVFHFAHVGVLTEASATSLTAAFKQFYDGWGVVGLSDEVFKGSTNLHEVQYANVAAGGPGPADDVVSKLLFRQSWELADNGSGACPREVALCLSYKSDLTGFQEDGPGATRPAARRRGRTYLGPLASGVLGSTSNGGENGRPIAGLQQAVINAYQSFIASVNLVTQQMFHGIYSPTNGTCTPIVAAWCDNAFDTIRSRGVKPTGRDTCEVSQATVVGYA